MLEAYTTLGYLAGVTSNVQLGVLVTGVTYRHPGLLAKIVATLDVLSGGRATLGIGAAWYEEEHRAMGVPYPPLAERFERLEETLQICRQMWDPTNDGPFDGTHYQLAQTLCSPAAADARPRSSSAAPASARPCAWSRSTATRATCSRRRPTRSRTSSTSCSGHCADVGRDPAEIRVTMLHGGERCSPGTSTGSSRRCAPTPRSASSP